jgi:toxin FitB
MIILDTNVLSALMRNVPEANIVRWLNQQPRLSIWTTSVNIFEIEIGLHVMPDGTKKRSLSADFKQLVERLDHRIAPFDEEAALFAAELAASRQMKGRTVEMRDTMIAGVVLARHAMLATRNVSHFSDISASVVNPWSV